MAARRSHLWVIANEAGTMFACVDCEGTLRWWHDLMAPVLLFESEMQAADYVSSRMVLGATVRKETVH